MNNYINLTQENVDSEHLCCAIADKKHQEGVQNKRNWIKDRIKEGHVFRKLDVNGKVFIEYSPLDTAWVPLNGNNFMYIYCLWVAGSYKGHGYAKELIEYAINDAKNRKMSGICTLSSKKKKPFISEKSFFIKYGFKVVDQLGDYELLSLNFNDESPTFNENVKQLSISSKELTIFYSPQCPYTNDCINQINEYVKNNNIKVSINKIDSLKKAKDVPCIFNNWAVFYNGKFISNTLLNAGSLEKLLKSLN